MEKPSIKSLKVQFGSIKYKHVIENGSITIEELKESILKKLIEMNN